MTPGAGTPRGVRRTGRIEDERLLAGRGRYTSDLADPDTLHAVLVRADRPHAVLRSVDATAAAAAPGVAAVLTGADLASEQGAGFPSRMPFPGRDGGSLFRPYRPVLARDRVRYVGEPVAVVVADSPRQAQDAADLLRVDYDDLPHVVDLRAALRDDGPRLYPDHGSNVCFDWETGDAAAVAAAFSEAAHVTTLTLRNARLLASPMEPLACVARYDAQADVATLVCPTQGPAQVRDQLCAVLGVAPDRLRVQTPDVGGAFGVKAHAYPEYAALVLAAKRVKRPVKWTSWRSETIVAEHHGRDSEVTARLALDSDGRFLAMDFHFVANMGAYLTANGALIMTKNPGQAMAGVYRTPAIHGRVTCVLTNTGPIGPYRGAGRPEMAYAIERLVDQAAAELGVDPVELRRRNLVSPADMPYRTPTASVYDSGEFEAVLDRATALADWCSFTVRRQESEQRGRLRGIGVGLFLEGTGAGPHERVVLQWDPDGTLEAICGTQSSGQGHETVFAELVARRLGIDVAQVRVCEGDSSQPTGGGPSVASRSLHATGSALAEACALLVDEGRAHAAAALDADAAAVTFSDGEYSALGRRIALVELARRSSPDELAKWRVEREIEVQPTFPNGCHVAEVEIDPDTGVASVCRYTCVDDFGTIANATLVEGQLHGGIAQGIGEALLEAARYDIESGQLLTGTLADYALPTADAIPEIVSEFHPVPCTTNLLGAKGAGEAGTTGAICALMNALHDAVRSRGIRHLDKPVTRDLLWRALRGTAG